MSVYLNLEIIPGDEAKRLEYLAKAGPISAKYGAKPVSTYIVQNSFGRANAPKVIALMQFPSEEAIEQLFADEEYKKTIPLRDQGFQMINYTVMTLQEN